MQRWPCFLPPAPRLLPSSLFHSPSRCADFYHFLQNHRLTHCYTHWDCSLALVAIIPEIGTCALCTPLKGLHCSPRHNHPLVRTKVNTNQHSASASCSSSPPSTQLTPTHLATPHFPSPHSAFHQAKMRDGSGAHNKTNMRHQTGSIGVEVLAAQLPSVRTRRVDAIPHPSSSGPSSRLSDSGRRHQGLDTYRHHTKPAALLSPNAPGKSPCHH